MTARMILQMSLLRTNRLAFCGVGTGRRVRVKQCKLRRHSAITPTHGTSGIPWSPAQRGRGQACLPGGERHVGGLGNESARKEKLGVV